VNARLVGGPSGGGRINRKGCTPFMLAADTADTPFLKLLVELGADPTITNVDNCTPLMAAAGLGTRSAEEEAGTDDEAVEACGYILSLGADINAVANTGDTAMHGAAFANFPKVVKFLESKGAKIDVWNQKNKRGWTPLLVAEGHRYGNFKPSFETIAAIKEVMMAHGITPPPPTPLVPVKGYGN
jgi:ankyrin repeat protein